MNIIQMYKPVKKLVEREPDHVDDAIDKIRRTGRRLKKIILIMALSGLLAAVYIILFGHPETMLQLPYGMMFNSAELGVFDRLVIILIAFLRPLAYAPVFWSLYRQFSLYEEGIVFSDNNIRWMKYTGFALVAIDVVVIIQSIITGPILTSLGIVDPYISISIGSSFLIVGLFVIFIARVMSLALVLKNERDLTV